MGDESGRFAGQYKDISVLDLQGDRLLVPLEAFEEGSPEITKCLLMDAIISLATGYHDIPEHEMAALKKLIEDEPENHRTAFPFGKKVSFEMSGFINSFLMRYPDWGDTMRLHAAKTGSGGHPNDALAAVLTYLDIPGITGKKIMELIRLSYELWNVFHNHLLLRYNGWDASSVMCLTVPVMTAVAYGASPERTQNAMQVGATLLGLLGCTRYAGAGGVRNMKNAACGTQVYKALWAYRMSELIQTTPATFTAPMGFYENVAPFEGEFKGISDLEVYGPLELKVWPVYNVAQGPVDCAAELHAQIKDKLDHIAHITIKKTKKDIIKIAQKMENRYPHNHATADHSPYWGVAVGLKYGCVGLHHFDAKYYKDPDIVRMLGISDCEVFSEEEVGREDIGNSVSATRVTVTMDDGTEYSAICKHHGGAFDGLSLTERASAMRKIVDTKQRLIEEAFGYDLSNVAKVVYDLEHQTGATLLNALHEALKP